MKARLSFATRRPSAAPTPMAIATSPKNAASTENNDDGPMPEPLAHGATPRASELNFSTVSLKDINSLDSSSHLQRSKSTVEVATKKKTSNLGEDHIFPNSIREGFLKKKGVVNVAWKKRFIVLLPHQLAYFDEVPNDKAVPKGFINLQSITKVVHHDMKDCSFDVVTPTRIFRLQAENQPDMDAWIASISGTAANEQQILASRKRNMSHAQLRGLTEEDRLKLDDSAKISHENAELALWPKWNAFEVAAWLQTFGMARWCADFYNANVTGEMFRTMDDAFLQKTIPDADKGDRTKILLQVKKVMHDAKQRG